MLEFSDLIDTIRKQQDKQDAWHKLLWPRFTDFSVGFVEGLTAFATEALNSGIRGVSELEHAPWPGEARAVSFMLNHRKIQLTYPSESTPIPSAFEQLRWPANTADPDGILCKLPTLRIWIDLPDEGDPDPYGYIELSISPKRELCCEFCRYLVPGHSERLGSRESPARDTDKHLGWEAADEMIYYFYEPGVD